VYNGALRPSLGQSVAGTNSAGSSNCEQFFPSLPLPKNIVSFFVILRHWMKSKCRPTSTFSRQSL